MQLKQPIVLLTCLATTTAQTQPLNGAQVDTDEEYVEPCLIDEPVKPCLIDEPVEPCLIDEPVKPCLIDEPVEPCLIDEPVEPCLIDEPVMEPISCKYAEPCELPMTCVEGNDQPVDADTPDGTCKLIQSETPPVTDSLVCSTETCLTPMVCKSGICTIAGNKEPQEPAEEPYLIDEPPTEPISCKYAEPCELPMTCVKGNDQPVDADTPDGTCKLIQSETPPVTDSLAAPVPVPINNDGAPIEPISPIILPPTDGTGYGVVPMPPIDGGDITSPVTLPQTNGVVPVPMPPTDGDDTTTPVILPPTVGAITPVVYCA